MQSVVAGRFILFILSFLLSNLITKLHNYPCYETANAIHFRQMDRKMVDFDSLAVLPQSHCNPRLFPYVPMFILYNV